MRISLSPRAGAILVPLLLAGLITLALALISLDVHPQEEVSASGEPVFVGLRQGERPKWGGSLRLRVTGSGPVAGALRHEVTGALLAAGICQEVSVSDVITERLGVALLDVRLNQAAGFWTPLLARSQIELEAAYSSDGDPNWLEQPQGVIAASADPVARVRIRVDGRYQNAGLVSRPGYYRALASSLAQSLAAELARQLAGGQ